MGKSVIKLLPWFGLSFAVGLWVFGLWMFADHHPAPPRSTARWTEAAMLFSSDHQWELICDADWSILAVVQPDDGGSWVVYGADRVAYGLYVDLFYAKRAAEDLKFPCPGPVSRRQ